MWFDCIFASDFKFQIFVRLAPGRPRPRWEKRMYIWDSLVKELLKVLSKTQIKFSKQYGVRNSFSWCLGVQRNYLPLWLHTFFNLISQPLTFTNKVYIFKIKWSIHVNYKIFYLKEVWYPSDQTHQKLFSYHISNRFKFQTKQNFMHFLGSSDILSWNQTRLKINSLTFYKMNFHTWMFPKSFFFIEWGCVPIRARASAKRLPPHSNETKLFSV